MNTMKNKVQLIGNLGNSPEIVNLQSGKKMAKFSLATNETYRNGSGEKKTETHWHNIVAWGSTANIAEKYLKKGNRTAVEGRLSSRSYEDKEGNKRYVNEVIVHEILLLNGTAA